MEEQVIITNKMNPHIDPVLSVWEWQIPVYLFLGGLTAGIMILGAVNVFRMKAQPNMTQKLLVLVTPLLALGMFALFLDLSHKLYVWRFYTAFRITAPMSWGAWLLLLVIPANLLLIAGILPSTWPSTYRWLFDRFERLHALFSFGKQKLSVLAGISLVLGIALGIYTGILLSAYGARPFWNTSILGPIFLVSGLSSAAALVQLASRDHQEQHFYIRVDLGLIAVELLLIGLMLINMVSGPFQQQRAASLVFGGELTVFFWVFVVMIGLLLPIVLETFHLKGRPLPRFLAPAFVIVGGLIFRFFIVEAGQLTAWIPY